MNDSDGSYANKKIALNVFDEYFPSYKRPYPDNGIFQSWTWGHVQFFLLDGRYNRSPSDALDDKDKTMLGREQKQWLKNELRHSTAVWKILISGSVFNPTVKCGADNWCEYRTEGKELMDFIRQNTIQNTVVISGDIHAGAITSGENSVYDSLWEMAVPMADASLRSCDTTLYQGANNFGQWTHGSWGKGFGHGNTNLNCWGYGTIEVLTNPHRLVLSVKDQNGETKVQAVVPLEESAA